jgi:predicted acyltransferase
MNEQPQRLTSLDFFRGGTVAAMILVNNPGDWGHVYKQLAHAPWHGWTFTDLIFPFFLFIVGVAIPIAFARRIERGATSNQLLKKIITRSLIIFGLGLIIHGFPYFDLSTIRIPGVLQRIAICYFFASLIFIFSSVRWQIYWSVILLFVYWALMEFIPVPGIGAGKYEMGANFAAYIDSLILKGHMWAVTETWDPEGIISTIPAISTTLFGVLTGHWLRSNRSVTEKTLWLLIFGNLGLLLGALWNSVLPINKYLWTSSYAVFMGGMALIVLAFSYYFIDGRGYKKGTTPFVAFGMNALIVYFISEIFAKTLSVIQWTNSAGDTVTLKGFLYNSIYTPYLQPMHASLAFAVSLVLIMFILVWILYKKRIFIKV